MPGLPQALGMHHLHKAVSKDDFQCDETEPEVHPGGMPRAIVHVDEDALAILIFQTERDTRVQRMRFERALKVYGLERLLE